MGTLGATLVFDEKPPPTLTAVERGGESNLSHNNISTMQWSFENHDFPLIVKSMHLSTVATMRLSVIPRVRKSTILTFHWFLHKKVLV